MQTQLEADPDANPELEDRHRQRHRHHPYQWQLASSSLRSALGRSPILGGVDRRAKLDTTGVGGVGMASPADDHGRAFPTGGPSHTPQTQTPAPVYSSSLPLSDRSTTPPPFRNTIVGPHAFQVPLGPGGRPRLIHSEYGSTVSAGEEVDTTTRWKNIYAEAIMVGDLPSRTMQIQARRDKQVFFSIHKLK
jgi:hypothetical protein